MLCRHGPTRLDAARVLCCLLGAALAFAVGCTGNDDLQPALREPSRTSVPVESARNDVTEASSLTAARADSRLSGTRRSVFDLLPPSSNRPLPATAPLPETVPALFDEARVEGQTIVRRYPDVQDALETWARLEFATGRYRVAADIWQCLVSLDGNYAYAHHGLGLVSAQLGEYEEAAQHQLAAVHLNPSLARAVHEAANALTKVGRVDEAVGVLNEFLSKHPEDVETLVQLGQTHLAARNYEDAHAAFARCVEHNDEIPAAQYGLAVALARLDKTTEARDASRRCSNLRRRQRKTELESRRKRSDFAENIQKIVPLFISASAVYQSQGDDSEVERLLRRAARLDESNEPSRIQLASFYMRTNQNTRAIEVCRELVVIDSKDPAHALNLGWLEMQSGAYSRAETCFQDVLRLAPDNTEAHFFLGQVFVQTNRFEEAAVSARKAAELSGNAACYALLAEALEQRGDHRAAREAISEALRRDPDNDAFLRIRERLRRNE